MRPPKKRQRATLDAIRSLRGSLKRKLGQKSLTQLLIENRHENLRLEEAQWKRFEKWLQRQRKLAKQQRPKR